MDYDEFLRAVADDLDLAWRKYRRRSSRRAIFARMGELGIATLAGYLGRVRSDPAEARALPDRMRVTVSRFLRDRALWEALFALVVPQLASRRSIFRVWCVGCCGGEEPYTVSLLWREHLAARLPTTPLRVDAWDIDLHALQRARRGLYETGSLRELDEDLRQRGFVRENRLWRVREELREPVRFCARNLLRNPPPRRIDLVLCRYLAFTYYSGARRAEAVRRLHAALRPGGALFIGRKEGLTASDLAWFEPWPAAAGVFRRACRPPRGAF